jgi:hypothetical protein
MTTLSATSLATLVHSRSNLGSVLELPHSTIVSYSALPPPPKWGRQHRLSDCDSLTFPRAFGHLICGFNPNQLYSVCQPNAPTRGPRNHKNR